MTRLRLAVIGVGHLGKEHARIFSGLPDVDCTQAFNDYWPLLNLVDAASIVVPTSLHRVVAREFLRRGIPLLIEKPLAGSLSEADELVELAQASGAVLQVGHIERFNPAYEELRRRPLQPHFIRLERLGPFTGRSTDVGVVMDLMIHDIDLLLDLVGAPVRTATALGLSVFGRHEDVANARLEFGNGCVAELTASRASPVASRRMQVWAGEGYADVDLGQRRLTLVQPSERVRQHGLDPARLDPASRARLREELFSRHLEMCTVDGQAQDQLTLELQHFVACVRTGSTPRVTGAHARQAVAVAELILHEMAQHAWDGSGAGPHGPLQLPPAAGRLFPRGLDQEVA
jgi:predicted dehydrogenase